MRQDRLILELWAPGRTDIILKKLFPKPLSTTDIHQKRGRRKHSCLLPWSHGVNSCCVPSEPIRKGVLKGAPWQAAKYFSKKLNENVVCKRFFWAGCKTCSAKLLTAKRHFQPYSGERDLETRYIKVLSDFTVLRKTENKMSFAAFSRACWR